MDLFIICFIPFLCAIIFVALAENAIKFYEKHKFVMSALCVIGLIAIIVFGFNYQSFVGYVMNF